MPLSRPVCPRTGSACPCLLGLGSLGLGWTTPPPPLAPGPGRYVQFLVAGSPPFTWCPPLRWYTAGNSAPGSDGPRGTARGIPPRPPSPALRSRRHGTHALVGPGTGKGTKIYRPKAFTDRAWCWKNSRYLGRRLRLHFEFLEGQKWIGPRPRDGPTLAACGRKWGSMEGEDESVME